MMLHKTIFLFSVVFFITIFSCKKKDVSEITISKNPSKTVVYVLPNDGPYYDLKWYGVKAELEMLGYTVKRESAGGYKNITKQVEIIENAIVMGVAGLIIHPVSDVAVKPIVERAIDQGIPVIAENVNIKSDKLSGTVMLENYANGWELAMALTSSLSGSGKVLALVGPPGHEQASTMWGAATTYFSKFKNIEIVREEYLPANSQAAYNVVESALIADPNIDGIYCWYVQNAIGAATAVKQQGKIGGKIKIVAKDIDDQSITLMKEDYITALLVGEPIKMGRESAKLLDSIIKGRTVERNIKLRNFLVTKDLLNQIDRSGFDPDFK